MRQRRIKNIDEKLANYSDLILTPNSIEKGHWRAAFIKCGLNETTAMTSAGATQSLEPDVMLQKVFHEKKLYLEIGSGKGKFITDSALSDPDGLYIGVEGLSSVILRGLEKAQNLNLENVRFIVQYVNDVSDLFDVSELDGVFLNFSDPWPKARHEKRRLTYHERMKTYAKVIKVGGFIKFKTDNDDLFEYTLEQVDICKKYDLEIGDMTRDLHSSELFKSSPETEYENKFASLGKNINYVALVRK